jgi:hypothetical protein
VAALNKRTGLNAAARGRYVNAYKEKLCPIKSK